MLVLQKEVQLIMGNIHTPKTIYSNGFVIEFEVKNKEVYYVISRWTKSGFDQGSLLKGKLGNQKPNDILLLAQHLVGDGIRQ